MNIKQATIKKRGTGANSLFFADGYRVEKDIIGMIFGINASGKRQVGSSGSWFQNPWIWILLVFYILILFLAGWHDPIFCDESSFMKNVLHFVVHRTAEPFYNKYPTFYSYFLAVPIYVVYFIYYVFIRRFPWEGLWDARLFALIFQGDIDIWIWVGRIITILIAAGTVVLVYRYCVLRFSRPAVIVVLTLLISSPCCYYMMYSRYALPDVPIAFLVTLIIYMAIRYIENPQSQNLYWASFLAGIAASAKLNGLLGLAPLVAAPWLTPSTTYKKLSLMFFVLSCAFLGFCVGSPLNVYRPDLYTSGFNYEASLLVSQSFNLFPQWVVSSLWREDPVMTVLMIAAILMSFFRHSPRDIIFQAIFFPAFICLGALAKHITHYFIPLFPWLCVVVGDFIDEILKTDRLKGIRFVLIAGLIALIVYEAAQLAVRVLHESRQNNRTLAREWIKQNIPRDTHVLIDLENLPRMGFINLSVVGKEEFIDKNNYPNIVREYVSRELQVYVKQIQTFNISLQQLKEQGWQYFVTSNSCFIQYLQDPSQLDAVVNGPNEEFIKYLQCRSFYLRLFRQCLDVKTFQDGSGPIIYIFRIM